MATLVRWDPLREVAARQQSSGSAAARGALTHPKLAS